MRILVCGGRDYDNFAAVRRVLNSLTISAIIEGGATGADYCASHWAAKASVPVEAFPAHWTDLSHPDAVIRTRRDGTKYDALAGLRRNQRMLDEGKPDLVVAFPGGDGTADMVRRARKAGVKVMEVA